MMNTVTLIGNAGDVAKITTFENGQKATFSLATNEKFKKADEEVVNTTWHNVIAWGALAEQCRQLIAKGSFVKVEGKIVYRQYINKEHKKVFITHVQAYRVIDMAG